MVRFANGSRGIAAVLLLAALLRAAMLWQFGGNLQRDVDDYRGIAANIVTGNGFSNPGTKLPTAYRPPLYPLLLSLVLSVGGGDLTIGVLQLLLGVVTVWLTFAVAKRLGLEERPAIIAAGLVAIDPLLLHNTTQVMTETLAATLAVAMLYLLCSDNQSTERIAVRVWLATGLVFGLCCLCRPTFWAWGVFLVGWAVPTITRDLRRRFGTRWWNQPTLLTIGIALVCAPWAIRNAIVMGRPILTTTHGGYTLLLAHNPVYYRDVVEQPWGTVWSGDSLRAWQQSLDYDMAHESPPVMGEVSRDRWMYQQARRVINGEFVMAIRSGLTLVGRLWNVVPLGDQAAVLPSIARWGIGLFYTATFLIMLLGLIRLRRDEWRRWWSAVALLLSFTAVHFFYWADMRMRAPFVPAIALLAARGMLILWNGFRRRRDVSYDA